MAGAARDTFDRVRSARLTLTRDLAVAQSSTEWAMYVAGVDDLLAADRLGAEWHDHDHDHELGGRWHVAAALRFGASVTRAAPLTAVRAGHA